MKSQLNPYLSFRNNAREAMEFYKGVFSGKLTMGTFQESNASKDPQKFPISSK
jgi:PhnB protein